MNTLQRGHTRSEISQKVRALRAGRGITQSELSKMLGLSQGRFSEIERGQGSFTAEQFLELLRVFNVPASHFVSEKPEQASEIQNALARLGASHLYERPDLLPSDLLKEAGDVIREVLLGAESPRHITALSPVLVHNIDNINLNKLRAQFLDYGLERRWGWLVENTLEAIRQELAEVLPRRYQAPLRRAELILAAHLNHALAHQPQEEAQVTPDILDAQIRSEKTLKEVQKNASSISLRWTIVTRLQTEDFLEALKASRVAH
jgi:transcriptional regulator with XRE-family HTH domain